MNFRQLWLLKTTQILYVNFNQDDNWVFSCIMLVSDNNSIMAIIELYLILFVWVCLSVCVLLPNFHRFCILKDFTYLDSKTISDQAWEKGYCWGEKIRKLFMLNSELHRYFEQHANKITVSETITIYHCVKQISPQYTKVWLHSNMLTLANINNCHLPFSQTWSQLLLLLL
jgi:hypothetical protein